ncbi:retron Ec78 anti-phage system effector ATPase PtuA [Serratia marcescens]|uniref:retron Ec78 anti-phage system effector ATPase PtuA n=1 Tax=Serratia marcescens TaxID=615 RepID=UPI0013DB8C5D|nr:retron Ec78 anti-phage system effector ATPase PtuA [Serratia marcescens]MBN5449304.1 AAA family ATPase [Serratia marcescens]
MKNHYNNVNQKNKIRALQRNAKKLNISSMFELIENYEDNTSVNLDLKSAEEYFNHCSNELSFVSIAGNETPKNKIKIDKLRLINFRKFKELNISFEDDITIFIGDNGAGKTTILDALARTFSYINARIIAKGRNGRPLDNTDVKVGCDDNAEVITSLSLGENTKYSGSLIRPAKGIENSKTSDLDSYSSLANLFRVINYRSKNLYKKEINIPLCIFYSVERSLLKHNLTLELEKLDTAPTNSRFDAIGKSALDGSSNIEEFLKWFIYIDNLENNDSIQNEIKILEAEIKAFELVAMQSNLLSDELEKRKIKLSSKQKLLSNTTNLNVGKLKQYVKHAVKNAVPSISDIYVDRSSGRVEVKIIDNGTHINIFQASKGQLVYLSLISDLARRLISMNPGLGNPLHGQGIVLIDEVELHLHPEWQQSIISNLTSTFPNIQFIITTHSPQVLSTITKQKIRKLSVNIEGEDIVAIPIAESYARSTSTVLSTVMHVEAIPDFPEKRMLDKYRKIIEQGDFRSLEATELYNKLVKTLGENHEELVSLSIVKRRREKLE